MVHVCFCFLSQVQEVAYRVLGDHQDKMPVSLRNSGKQSHCLNNLLPSMEEADIFKLP